MSAGALVMPAVPAPTNFLPPTHHYDMRRRVRPAVDTPPTVVKRTRRENPDNARTNATSSTPAKKRTCQIVPKSSTRTRRRSSQAVVPEVKKQQGASLESKLESLSLEEEQLVGVSPNERRLVYMLQEQDAYMPNPHYLKEVQTDVQGFMRFDMLSWLLQLNHKLEFHSETLAVAANLFDRLLSISSVQAGHLQLIAATCYMVAAKMHEVWNTHPSFTELIIASNHAYTGPQLEKMEMRLLQLLGWKLNPVTPHLLVHQVLLVLPVTETERRETVRTAEDCLDRCILRERFLAYKPSVLAAAVLIRSLSAMGLREKYEEKVLGLLKTSDWQLYEACAHDVAMVMFECNPVPVL
eukprot:comp12403_c0_seq1/m.7300 comp12403_c0_seq1/g.7300  ORF comp12403_c0_seq1/g.7300 comp12403_c0_seq1/m.7300 type:complete len:353 (-) comp12403_c0_seq1:790-1848(-)